MALPTKNLPFEYTDRWAQLGGLFVPKDLPAELVNRLDKRDKDLEDYLATIGTGGSSALNSASFWGDPEQVIVANSGSQPLANYNFRASTGTGSTWDLSSDLEIYPGIGLYWGAARCFGSFDGALPSGAYATLNFRLADSLSGTVQTVDVSELHPSPYSVYSSVSGPVYIDAEYDSFYLDFNIVGAGSVPDFTIHSMSFGVFELSPGDIGVGI